MQGLFFDVRPKPGHMPRYFEHVDRLKPILAEHDGMLELERFCPLDDRDALLSHQIWRSDDDIARWRCDATHRASQAAGQRLHFEGYRIRVGPVVWETRTSGRPDLPSGRYLVAAYGASAGTKGRAYESITNEGRFLTLTDADGPEALEDACAPAPGADLLRIFDVTRDYTMTERAEAPQPLKAPRGA